MKLGKKIISLFILFVYSTSYAHTILPHCHYGEDAAKHNIEHNDKLVYQVKHHQHNLNEVSNHEHIAHQNHFDDMFIDYLICLLNETDHLPLDQNEYYQKHTIKSSLKDKYCNEYFLLPYKLNICSSVEIITTPIRKEVFILYQNPSFNSTPHRGPPIKFC